MGWSMEGMRQRNFPRRVPDERIVLQLSDPHLLADPQGRYRGVAPLAQLRHGLATALQRLEEAGLRPDLLLLSGDLCQDESWGGYARLRELLAELAPTLPTALLPGNHDHPLRMTAALGRRCRIAPGVLALGAWRILLLDSHRPATTAGWLGDAQLAWLRRRLAERRGPLLVVVHHPPVPIGDPEMDAIGLRDGGDLLTLLGACPEVRGLMFGHVHQHWQGGLPGRAGIPLLGCPSTLCGFGPVQACPLGRPDDPGGRLLRLRPDGMVRQHLLRWQRSGAPNVSE
jgi:Icc protein